MTGRFSFVMVTLVLTLAGGLLFAADAALEKTVERAKEKRTQDIEKAGGLYHTSVDRANASLIRVLETNLAAAKRKGDEARVTALTAAIEALKAGEEPTIEEGDKLIEGAAKRRSLDIEQANKAFKTAVERANTALSATYTSVIANYKRKSDARGDELTTELASIKSEEVTPAKSESATASKPKGNGSQALIKQIGPNLVNAQGKPVTSAMLADKDYVLVYYSASWCGPCRAFTPDLVKFHEDYAKKGNFEVILMSSDRSEGDMTQYMVDGKMPWLAVPYDKRGNVSLAPGHNVTGIPHLALMDKEGNLVAHDGPRKVLADLKDKLKLR